MTPEFPPNNPRAELEARLTAFILGELPAHEAAALRQAMDDDAELAALYERLKAASKLVREAAASPVEQTKEPAVPLRLSEERRQKLLAQFKTVAPKEFTRDDRDRKVGIRILQVAAVVAAMGVLAALLLPSLAKSKSKSLSATYRLREIEMAENRQKAVLAPRSVRQNQEKAATVSKDSYSVKQNLLEPMDLGAPRPLLTNTTIVLPSTEIATAITTTTLSGYNDISMEWNAGTGTHQPKNAFAVAGWANAEVTNALPALQDSFASGKIIRNDSSANTPQNSQLYQRSQTLTFDSGESTVSRASGGGGNAGAKMSLKYANPSDISAGLAQLGPESAQPLANGAGGRAGGSGGGGGSGGAGRQNLEPRDLRALNEYRVNNASQELAEKQVHAGELDPVTGLPVGPSPTDKSGPGPIDPVTGFSFARLSQDGSLDTSFHPEPGVPVQPPPITLNYSTSPTDQPTGASAAAPQVEIKAKFADITQETNRAFGFNFQAKNYTNAGTFTLPPGGITQTYGGPIPGLFPDTPTSEFANAQKETLSAPLPASTPKQAELGINALTAPEVATESGRASEPQIAGKNGFSAVNGTLTKRDQDMLAGTIPSQTIIERIPAWHSNEVQTAAMVQDGKLLLQAGKLDEAEAKLADAYQLDPGSAAAQQYLELIRQKRMAEATRRSGVHSEDAILQVENSWDVEQRQGKLEPHLGPNSGVDTNTMAFNESLSPARPVRPADRSVQQFSENGLRTFADHTGDTNADSYRNLSLLFPGVEQGQATNESSQGETLNVVGYVNVTVPASTNYVSTNGVIDQDKTALAQTGKVTVTADPETKKSFLITDADTIQSVTNAIIQIDRNGASSPPNVVHYNSLKIGGNAGTNREKALKEKTAELDALMAERKVLANKAGEDTKAPATVIAQARIAQSKTLGGKIRGAFTGNVTEMAQIRLDRNPDEIGRLEDRRGPAVYDPYFIQTESETLRSEKILDQVIDKLKLNEAWAKKEGAAAPLTTTQTRQLLRNSLQIGSGPKTNVLDIKVKSDEQAEAAKIANTIAEVYTDYRKKQWDEAGYAKASEQEVTKMDREIAVAKAELAQLASEPANPQADTPLPKPAADAPVPQPEVTASENAFSTFSLNVADVSFKLAAASLEKGRMPDPSTIRSEEFVNAFDYRDPEPAPGAPLGFAWERAQYPFAHNRDLLRFAVKTAAAGREAGKPMNIVLLLDKSGSMERADRVRIIHEALRVLATQLGPQDKLSVVTFARVARLWVDGLPGSQAGEVVDGLDKLTPEGGTNLEEAMRLAYETARRHYLAGGINRVVLLTDGAANLGNVDPASLNQKVEQHRKEGIALDCFGVGWEGYNDDLLEVLSRHGDGRYGFINTPEEAANGFAKQLAGALHVAAADVKVQVEFNPKRVTAYRQIGYAKHQLTKEQFRDNTVDAAEIGAAESGNALYVVEVNPNGEGPLATVRVRYKVPGTEDYPEHEWPVPYTGSATPLEQASPAMRLAGTASAFSESLATSPFAGEVTSDQLLGLMRGVPETYGADERPKKLEWMIRQAKSLTGK